MEGFLSTVNDSNRFPPPHLLDRGSTWYLVFGTWIGTVLSKYQVPNTGYFFTPCSSSQLLSR
jgi:hypothetical protein